MTYRDKYRASIRGDIREIILCLKDGRVVPRRTASAFAAALEVLLEQGPLTSKLRKFAGRLDLVGRQGARYIDEGYRARIKRQSPEFEAVREVRERERVAIAGGSDPKMAHTVAVKEVAGELGKTPRTIYSWIRKHSEMLDGFESLGNMAKAYFTSTAKRKRKK